MRAEFLRRLGINPEWTFEILLASLVINVLALSSSLYSIQVLNRYLTMGIDATLYTLTFGVLIALIFEILLKNNRLKLTQKICEIADKQMQMISVSFLGMGQYANIAKLNLGQRKEVFTGLQLISQAFGPINLTSLFDLPFCLVFLFVLALINPFLAKLVASWIVILSIIHLILQYRMRANAKELGDESIQTANIYQYYLLHPESVRSFQTHNHVQNKYFEQGNIEQQHKLNFQGQQNILAQLGYLGSMVGTLIIYGIGSREVILGRLDVGTLIGASILSSRAIGNVTKGLQLLDQFVKARYSLGILSTLAKQPLEVQSGLVPSEFQGNVEIVDLSFQYEAQMNPVFESLNLKAQPGSIVVFKGRNGSGKTTVARLISSLIRPTRGNILIDDLELSQVVPDWWRKQILYMPQEPGFFQGTLFENLTVLNPEVESQTVMDYCNSLGLGEFLNSQEGGLHMMLSAAPNQLPRGIARRFTLVRALIGDGKVVILDDPTEAIDPSGCQAIANYLNEFVNQGKTMFITSNDPFVTEGAHILVDLDSKPVPTVSIQKKPVQQSTDSQHVELSTEPKSKGSKS